MSTFSQFFPTSGGGGLTPKFQDFTSSGSFTPTQALIDAGGYLEAFVVGGGGRSNSSSRAASGGEAQLVPMYLTNTNSVTVVIGAGATSSSGNQSQFLGATAGGVDVTSRAGSGSKDTQDLQLSPGWGNKNGDTAAGNGFFGYGAGGAGIANEGGVGQPKANSGQGGEYLQAGGSGFVRVMWYE
jgi:hypothetical protein